MWDGDNFCYTKSLLRAIARQYEDFYPSSALEIDTKADFDLGLNRIGAPYWTGEINEVSLRGFNIFQRTIIRDLLGFPTKSKLRNFSYYLMASKLNGGNIDPRSEGEITGGEEGAWDP